MHGILNDKDKQRCDRLLKRPICPDLVVFFNPPRASLWAPLPLDDGPARIAFDSNFDSPGFAYRVTTLHRDLFLAMVSSLHVMVKCVMQMIYVLHVKWTILHFSVGIKAKVWRRLLQLSKLRCWGRGVGPGEATALKDLRLPGGWGGGVLQKLGPWA